MDNFVIEEDNELENLEKELEMIEQHDLDLI